jgi:putative hydrolase of the HAD superfamily
MISAVLFDLDETLLDRTNSLKDFLTDQYSRFGAKLGVAGSGSFCKRFLALDARGQTHKSIVYSALIEEFSAERDSVAELLADYQERCCLHARGFAGMRDVLATLRMRGLKLGIVTNGETKFQTRQIEALELHTLVDTILISESEGVRKPDRELFIRAANRLCVNPGACVFVGDTPLADVLGAHAAGMRTVWFNHDFEWPNELPANPGATVKSLSDILMHVDLNAR